MEDTLYYDYLFHFNPHAGLWTAYKRDDHHAYWNGETPKDPFLKSRDLNTIFYILQKQIIDLKNGN